jgi:hypothetical protein
MIPLLTLLLPHSIPAEEPMSYEIRDVPDDYQLQAYDDCGVSDRQPHIVVSGGTHEYSPASVNADERCRTVAWGWREVRARYESLDPNLPYVLVVTYANEPFNHRVQSLWAGSVQLHGPLELPKGGVRRVVLRVPPEVVREGALELELRLEAHVNVVVSVLELWAPKPSPTALHLSPIWALYGDLHGTVGDLRFDPVEGAEVSLRQARDKHPLAEMRSAADGGFRFDRRAIEHVGPAGGVEVVARHAGAEASRVVPLEDSLFAPVRYRPIPVRQAGLEESVISLDGDWWVHPEPIDPPWEPIRPEAGWKPFRVPGQWVQQGYDLPPGQEVAVAREFVIPKSWVGRRVILRFDAIHAGARYRLNTCPVGVSEHLFTPVELDVSQAVSVGLNRLDVLLTVDTPSERLSYSSGYAFHNLGGIDRSVRLFALPRTAVRALSLNAGLDEACRDGVLEATVALEGPTESGSLMLRVGLLDAHGAPVDHSSPAVEVPPDQREHHLRLFVPREIQLRSVVPNVLAWNAEKPHLYTLRLDLMEGRRLVERIERRIGFRKVEVRGSQLYVNGRRVKLAGACHHETDPLTGRADTARHAETDVRLMKDANLNYIRTSHYPPTEELLQAADRLGMYVEVEAPFCWVGNDNDPAHLRAVLTPTSAMIDACRDHPSVVLWSLANESQFNPLFEVSQRLCRDLDPTRPTTFNNPDPKRLCDIANLHYPGMPYDGHLQGDPRPILLGEYFFPICHEQTDVRINPGLRELWGLGHSAPDSAWGRECAEAFRASPGPGALPGTWTYMRDSDRVIGGAIWAALDDAFYLPDGRDVGYAWHHGFWGLIDAWRRPKPEWWLAKMIFSPVWFPVRHVEWQPGMTQVEVPVENRYAFTDLSELRFAWNLGAARGHCSVQAAPDKMGTLSIPVPDGLAEGAQLTIEARDAAGCLVTTAVISLGQRRAERLPEAKAGPPNCTREGDLVVVRGEDFGLVLNATTGTFETADPRHTAPVLAFPTAHFTRFDFGDLRGPGALPYCRTPAVASSRPLRSRRARRRPNCG